MAAIFTRTESVFRVLFLLLCIQLTATHATSERRQRDENSESSAAAATNIDNDHNPLTFFRACQNGPLSSLQRLVERHPDWVSTRRTATGETCLHLASLGGHLDILRWLLQSSDDFDSRHAEHLVIDERTRGDRALRETPLGMSVKNGNVEAARLLLEAGADVNLEFDSMMGGLHSVTVMDFLIMVLPSTLPDKPSPTMLKYVQMKELLLEYGALRWSDLQTASEL